MARKIKGVLYKRNRYQGSTTPQLHLPVDRLKLAGMLGSADKVWIHARMFDRGSNSPSVTFDVAHGCMGDQMPREGIAFFALTLSDVSPTLPWNTTNLTPVPNDGVFSFVPGMGLADIGMIVSGSGVTWIEIEVWFTAIYNE